MHKYHLNAVVLMPVLVLARVTLAQASTTPSAVSSPVVAIAATCQNAAGKATASERISSCSLLLRSTTLQGEPRAHVYLNRAWALTVEKKWAAAMTDYDAAIKLSPKMAVAYSEKGFARLRMEQYDLAIANYDKALALDAKTAYSWFGRGIARLRKNDKSGAMQDIEMARKLDPQVDATFARVGFKF